MKRMLGLALGWVSFLATVHALDPTLWQARHGMTSSDYQNTFNTLVGQGYRLTYVSGYTFNNDPRYAALWEQKSGPDWVARDGMTGSDYQTQFNTYVAQGFRLILVNGYPVNGVPQYAAIWDKSASPGWVARHGMSSSDYQTVFNQYTSQGYRLTRVSGYSQGNTALYAAIWEKSTSNVAWVARHGMTSSEYQSQFDLYVSQGYRLIHVSGYVVNNVDYYAAIWDKSPSGPWVARHGMSSSVYQSEFNNWIGQGYRLKLVSGYTLNSNQDTYAALWIQE
jgi:Bacterial tandem repeat domain 1